MSAYVLGTDFEKQGNLWMPTDTLAIPFSPPNPMEMEHQLTEDEMYGMAIVANEIVKVAYNRSILYNPTSEDLQSDRYRGSVSRTARVLTPRDQLLRGQRHTVPGMANVDGLELTGLEAENELEGLHAVRINFTDEQNQLRSVRVTPDWAMIDDQPLDRATYQTLMAKMVFASVKTERDKTVTLLGNLLSLVGQDTRRSPFFGVVIDKDSSSDIIIESDYDRKDLDQRTNTFVTMTIVERQGLANPDEYYHNYGQHKDVEASDASTETVVVFTMTGQVIVLSKPLNDPPHSSFSFLEYNEDFLDNLNEKIDDLEYSRLLAGGYAELNPFIIDRRDSGVTIQYKLARAAFQSTVAASGMPKIWRPMSEAKLRGFDRQVQEV